jgi:hypothetical protein
VSIRKAPKAVSKVRDGCAGDDRRGFSRYPYHEGSAGLVDGTVYPACSWGVDCFVAFGEKASRGPLSFLFEKGL